MAYIRTTQSATRYAVLSIRGRGTNYLTHLSKIEGVIRSLKGLPVLIQLNLIHNFILGFIERE